MEKAFNYIKNVRLKTNIDEWLSEEEWRIVRKWVMKIAVLTLLIFTINELLLENGIVLVTYQKDDINLINEILINIVISIFTIVIPLLMIPIDRLSKKYNFIKDSFIKESKLFPIILFSLFTIIFIIFISLGNNFSIIGYLLGLLLFSIIIFDRNKKKIILIISFLIISYLFNFIFLYFDINFKYLIHFDQIVESFSRMALGRIYVTYYLSMSLFILLTQLFILLKLLVEINDGQKQLDLINKYFDSYENLKNKEVNKIFLMDCLDKISEITSEINENNKRLDFYKNLILKSNNNSEIIRKNNNEIILMLQELNELCVGSLENKSEINKVKISINEILRKVSFMKIDEFLKEIIMVSFQQSISQIDIYCLKLFPEIRNLIKDLIINNDLLFIEKWIDFYWKKSIERYDIYPNSFFDLFDEIISYNYENIYYIEKLDHVLIYLYKKFNIEVKNNLGQNIEQWLLKNYVNIYSLLKKYNRDEVRLKNWWIYCIKIYDLNGFKYIFYELFKISYYYLDVFVIEKLFSIMKLKKEYRLSIPIEIVSQIIFRKINNLEILKEEIIINNIILNQITDYFFVVALFLDDAINFSKYEIIPYNQTRSINENFCNEKLNQKYLYLESDLDTPKLLFTLFFLLVKTTSTFEEFIYVAKNTYYLKEIWFKKSILDYFIDYKDDNDKYYGLNYYINFFHNKSIEISDNKEIIINDEVLYNWLNFDFDEYQNEKTFDLYNIDY